MSAFRSPDSCRARHEKILSGARAAFGSGRTRPYAFRAKQLENLLRMLDEHESLFLEALRSDLHKPKQESMITEIELGRNDVRGALSNLKDWMKPTKAEKSVATLMDSTFIQPEPYGVCLLIGPWNYPVQLIISPLVGAIAAGNCVVIKPSEVAPATASLWSNLIPKYLDQDCYPVITGGKEETTELLKERFDFLFFTGSATVGKIVREAANKYLTPCTLELGGKCPVYLDESCNLSIAVKRIMWGKLLNAGQTCIAPDYILCPKDLQLPFVEKAKELMQTWYGKDMRKTPDFCRIINAANVQRLETLLKTTEGQVVMGGSCYESDLYVEPTILTDVKPSDAIMQQEIFGPILPLVPVKNLDDALQFINSREKPLAVYTFSRDKNVKKRILEETSSGQCVFNETIMQAGVDSLPFGGIGMSGMGKYHGKFSFDTFSHGKACLAKDLSSLGEWFVKERYAPYSESKLKYLTFMLKKRVMPVRKCFGSSFFSFLFGVALTVVIMEFLIIPRYH